MCLTAFSAFSLSFRVQAPTTVAMGEEFPLTYYVDAAGGKDLYVPRLSSVFDILSGPNKSSSGSTTIINGHVSSSFQTSFSFVLIAKREGSIVIPAATIIVEGKKYTSRPVRITVYPSGHGAVTSSSSHTSARRYSSALAIRSSASGKSLSARMSGCNLFVRAIPSKVHLYEQDCLLLTYKLYSLVDVVSFLPMLPNYRGFLKQDVDQGKHPQLRIESYKGKNYMTAVLYQVLLYPQQMGKIKIDKADFEIVVRSKDNLDDIFDSYFPASKDIKKRLTAPAVDIKVEKLPVPKPVDFSGAVGNFNFSSSISSQNVYVNDPITIRYIISGNGNLKLVNTPNVTYPSSFETYDPKVNNKVNNTASGVQGSKVIEYLVIPRSVGDFEIPEYKFSYFNPHTSRYCIISSPSYKVHVKKGAGNATANQAMISGFSKSQQDMNKNIRYIDTDVPDIQSSNNYFFGTFAYWLCFILSFIIAVVLFVIFRKQIRENADVKFSRHKHANKTATKRLKEAKLLLDAGDKEHFYDETLRALWGYLSDKLSIPVAALSKDNVEEELAKRGVELSNINEFMDIISTCEFARYAPSEDEHAMGDFYERAAVVIDKFQQVII